MSEAKGIDLEDIVDTPALATKGQREKNPSGAEKWSFGEVIDLKSDKVISLFTAQVYTKAKEDQTVFERE